MQVYEGDHLQCSTNIAIRAAIQAAVVLRTY
jgi:hypothetical protein